MKTADLLALADREAELLAKANENASAAVMRALAERVRTLSEKLRAAGVQESK